MAGRLPTKRTAGVRNSTCRRVGWSGSATSLALPTEREIPQVRTLVRPLPEFAEDPFTELTLPLTALPFLSVAGAQGAAGLGRAHKPVCQRRPPPGAALSGQRMERRRLVRVGRPIDQGGRGAAGAGDRDPGRVSGLCRRAALRGHRCGPRRLVAIPCWEIFRVYYAGAPRVARLLFDFPRWKAGTLDQMLRSFDGHRFFGPARGAGDRMG